MFTERTVVKLRSDQLQSVRRIAGTFGLTVSEVVRWWIDAGIRAVEDSPGFATLEGLTHDETES